MKLLKALGYFLTVIVSALFILSLSISLPITFRDFYYGRIDHYGLIEASGESRETIIDAYDELLDSLTSGAPFGTGVFSCSKEAEAHFMDCKFLFLLDYAVLGVSTVFMVGYSIYKIRNRKNKSRVISPLFFGSLIAVFPIAFFGIYLAVDVWEAYRFFHQVLFYGKSNWLFDITRDGILAILPQQFFIDCGVMIGISVVTLSLIFIICSITAVILTKKHKNLQKNV